LRVRATAALLALVVGLALAQAVQLEDRAFEIGRQLRCPVCVAESVADSNAQIAQEMRQLIQQQLEQGRSEKQILAYFQTRYGDWILLDPPKRGWHLVVWVLPVLAAAGGVVALGLLFARWRRAADAPIEVDAEELERVRRELGSDR
jgi:cytochrome c-type biogenesis protein CcmH